MSTILALDTTAGYCAVAVTRDDVVLATQFEEMSKGQAERLFPLIDAALGDAELQYSELDAIAVAVGPGNFTGVRICVSAARGLALSLGIPAIGVSVLEALAFEVEGYATATLDARAGRIYAQSFENGTPVAEPTLIEADAPVLEGAVLGYLANAPMPKPEVYAHIARRRNWVDAPRPSPLYLRDADAALPRDPAPIIIP